MQKVHTDPRIIAGMISILDPKIQNIHKEIPEDIDKACIRQNAIGPISLFQGYLSKAWSGVQKTYCQANYFPGYSNMDLWGGKILTLLLNYAHGIWMERNQ